MLVIQASTPLENVFNCVVAFSKGSISLVTGSTIVYPSDIATFTISPIVVSMKLSFNIFIPTSSLEIIFLYMISWINSLFIEFELEENIVSKPKISVDNDKLICDVLLESKGRFEISYGFRLIFVIFNLVSNSCFNVL